ncbi:MAG: PbpA [Desulfosarcina sp.]|nr:PbpA [Desulfobacterales bacterium]
MATFHPPNDLQKTRRRPSWRRYQDRLHRTGRWRLVRRKQWLWLLIPALAAAAYWIIVARSSAIDSWGSTPRKPLAPSPQTETLFSKADIRNLLAGHPTSDILEGPFNIRFGDRSLRVESTIAADLQHYLQKQLYRRTSRYIAIVVLNPINGHVLAMVGYDKNGREPTPCLTSRFPAASLFKIVTAAAALEECGYTRQSSLTFNGAKHTLYKSQLKDVRNRYTRHTTLAESFAQSINPVFGKIGRHCLGREKLQRYADRFGFDRTIEFGLDLPPSRTRITDEPYQWAEIASGFNHQTVISPLHGAILAAVAPAEGRLVEPTIIGRVTDQDGNELYHPAPTSSPPAVSPATARELARLMQRTVTHGTARKIFRRMLKDKVLSRLTIGGKTGSIDTRDHGARYDWFVGFADGPDRGDAIAVSVLVAHEKYIGRRAGEYARRAIREYFRQRFEQAERAGGIEPKAEGNPLT